MQTVHPLRHYSTLQCRDTGHWERVMGGPAKKGREGGREGGRKEEREGRKEGRRDRGRGRE